MNGFVAAFLHGVFQQYPYAPAGWWSRWSSYGSLGNQRPPRVECPRRFRRVAPLDLDEPEPEPHGHGASAPDPEQEALLADAIGLAMLIMLDTSRRRSGSVSCCTTSSACPSTRSVRSSDAASQHPASWQAARVVASDDTTPATTRAGWSRPSWSMPSSRRRAAPARRPRSRCRPPRRPRRDTTGRSASNPRRSRCRSVLPTRTRSHTSPRQWSARSGLDARRTAPRAISLHDQRREDHRHRPGCRPSAPA